MTNEEVWSHYKDYTRDLTDFSRKLAFASAGICWLLKTPTNLFPQNIYLALLFDVGFFVADILQGLTASMLLRWWIRREEVTNWKEKGTIEGDYHKPAWLDYPAFAFFLLKILSLLLSFIFIGMELIIKR